MGPLEKVTLPLIMLAVLQTNINCLRLPRKYTTRPCARSNTYLEKQPVYDSQLQEPAILQNFKCDAQKYGETIRKEFNFPEIEYSGISKCFSNYQYQEPLKSNNARSPQDLVYKSHNDYSSWNKNDINQKSINIITKNEQNTYFPELFSSAPSYRDVANFPDVEYPLCASELWKPNFWNGYLTDPPSNNNLYCLDKKFNHSVREEKPFRNSIKKNNVPSTCVSNRGFEIITSVDKDFNVTLEPKGNTLNPSSQTNNLTNIKKCENTLLGEDKDNITLSCPDDCSYKLLPIEDTEDDLQVNEEDYTTDDPEYNDSFLYAQSTVAPKISTTNEFTWENTKVIEMCSSDVDELNDYFISV
ncbi:uncharacterized protein LOC120637806 [Pararge aegeria]|uniref:Jg9858 protein n=1 Tax=Pararge aegeria aegeria TaxID=348720 RepID=A0A8S4QNR5_9NEOP|nr:uncharacterized protein LOC120637806 [Pararge aegeria]CAH2216851.1 jg9858 [Pararge aegeria aegeria]